MWKTWLCALVVVNLSTFAAAQAGGPAPRRVAIVVGANAAAPGRKPLRFAQSDANAFAQVLTELGGFARSDVHVLLDPQPEQVLSTLDAALSALHGEAVIVFYYSGHADAAALYPGGQPLTFASLRERLSDARASVRIGIIDACRGGGWTGSKGMSEAPAFEVDPPLLLNNEGSVLIASSSGLEDAHESEQLRGSFFTHYWNAALRGAADSDADGQVTLREAFDYSKALTIRDSALYTRNPQHPSFAMNLRGRQDLALSTLAAAGGSSATLNVTQHSGPLELVHLGSGVVVLELPKGERELRLAVAPGRYLLRRRQDDKTWARELAVEAGQTTPVDEAQLVLFGQPELAVKSAEPSITSLPRPLTLTTLPRAGQQITVLFGVSHSDPAGAGVQLGGGSVQLGFYAPHGLTDRLQWMIPTLALAYRIGDAGATEWVPWGGLTSWALGYSSTEGTIISGNPGAGLDTRHWLTPSSSLDLGIALGSKFRWHAKESSDIALADPQFVSPNTWRSALSVGYNSTIANTVTIHLALSYGFNLLYEGALPRFSSHGHESDMVLSFGSVQSIGLRPQPLVRVYLSDWVALDLHAAVRCSLATGQVHETYMVGMSFFW